MQPAQWTVADVDGHSFTLSLDFLSVMFCESQGDVEVSAFSAQHGADSDRENPCKRILLAEFRGPADARGPNRTDLPWPTWEPLVLCDYLNLAL